MKTRTTIYVSMPFEPEHQRPALAVADQVEVSNYDNLQQLHICHPMFNLEDLLQVQLQHHQFTFGLQQRLVPVAQALQLQQLQVQQPVGLQIQINKLIWNPIAILILVMANVLVCFIQPIPIYGMTTDHGGCVSLILIIIVWHVKTLIVELIVLDLWREWRTLIWLWTSLWITEPQRVVQCRQPQQLVIMQLEHQPQLLPEDQLPLPVIQNLRQEINALSVLFGVCNTIRELHLDFILDINDFGMNVNTNKNYVGVTCPQPRDRPALHPQLLQQQLQGHRGQLGQRIRQPIPFLHLRSITCHQWYPILFLVTMDPCTIMLFRECTEDTLTELTDGILIRILHRYQLLPMLQFKERRERRLPHRWQLWACIPSCCNLLGPCPVMRLTLELWNNEGQRPTVVEPPKDALNRILSHINSNHFPVKRKKKLMKKMKLINVQFVYVVSRLCSKKFFVKNKYV